MPACIKRLIASVLIASAAFAPAAAGAAEQLSGAGSTFIYPVLAKWASAYHRETGVKVNYQSIGSGGGIRQIQKRTVDFGASDAPLKAAALARAGLVQFPVVMGGVVPVVNVPGVGPGELRLSGGLLADIFLGKVRRWDDPRIAAENPGLRLPGRRITVVHRADGSGTTWIFSNYLSKVSPDWKSRVGFGKSLAWPTGVGGKGNEGVAAYVRRIKGAIGYVEFAYALQNRMSHVRLRNRAGRYVEPSIESFQAAAASADWSHAEGFYLVLTDQPGEATWPISGATFVLVPARPRRPERTRAVLAFFDWVYRKGADMTVALHYVPIPAEVAGLVRRTWSEQVRGPDGRPLWRP